MKGYKIARENQTTAQVVAALTRHPTWKAEAPDAAELSGCIARVDSDGDIEMSKHSCYIVLRSDWTIYRPKRKLVKVGVFDNRKGLGETGWNFANLERKRYELFAREVDAKQGFEVEDEDAV